MGNSGFVKTVEIEISVFELFRFWTALFSVTMAESKQFKAPGEEDKVPTTTLEYVVDEVEEEEEEEDKTVQPESSSASKSKKKKKKIKAEKPA